MTHAVEFFLIVMLGKFLAWVHEKMKRTPVLHCCIKCGLTFEGEHPPGECPCKKWSQQSELN